jgi:multidrug efflux pump subunit AcrA (membrane-fusion protein)
MKNKAGKKIIIGIAVVLLLAGVLFTARYLKNNSQKEEQTYRVRSETHENVIEIAGVIKAAHEQTLQAAGAGTVMRVFVSEGDTVKKGDTILQLDDTEQQYNLAKLDYEIAQKRITGAERELTLMQKQREVLIQRIQDRKVIANFDGIIASFSVAAGDYFEAKDGVGIIVDRAYLRTEVEVVETDAPKLRVGQKVLFTFPAYKNGAVGTVEGRVVSFPAVGTVTTRGATVVKAEVRIDEPPVEIIPNYSFTGKIEITPPETIVFVERLAIGYENGRAYAEKITGTSLERVDVRVEPYGKEYVSIVSGLKEGDTVKAQQAPIASGNARRAAGAGAGRAAPSGGGMPPIRL